MIQRWLNSFSMKNQNQSLERWTSSSTSCTCWFCCCCFCSILMLIILMIYLSDLDLKMWWDKYRYGIWMYDVWIDGYNYHHCQRVDGWLLSSMENGDFEGGPPGGEQPMETFNGETFSFSPTMFQMILAVEISTFISSPPLFSCDMDFRSWNTYSFRRPGKDVGTTHSMRYQGWDNLLRCDIPRARAFV